MGGTMLEECLISLPAGVIWAVIGLLPHVLPVWGGVLQFPGDKGFTLPRYRELDARIRVQSIPEHIGN